MYVIETELGRFEGETEKDAKKLLKAAEKHAREQEKIESGWRELADLKASAKAYHMMWDFMRNYSPKCSHWIITPNDRVFPRYVRLDGWKLIIRADDFEGAPAWHYTDSYKVLGFDLSCDGSMRAIWLQYSGENTCGYAVGYHEGVVALRQLPDQITLEWCKGETREPVNAPVSILA